jgi:hypothetical protein
MAWIADAIGRVRGGALNCVEAAALLGISERHFRRLRDAYLEGGAEAIIDKRRRPLRRWQALDCLQVQIPSAGPRLVAVVPASCP